MFLERTSNKCNIGGVDVEQVEQRDLLKEKVQNGFIVESMDDMNEEYLNALQQTLIIVGDTELMSVPSLLTVYDQAPNLNQKITALAVMQDEIGHAHIAYHLLRDLGVDTEELLYNREAHLWKNPYAFDFPISNWVELGVFNAFFDRAGYTLLGDVYEHTSYGPWKRALVKVDREELFHLRNGETLMRKAMESPETEKMLKEAVEWMFPMALEFFGVADELKSRTLQLEYRLKGRTNDELRQKWLSTAVPFCESIGLKVPAHYDPEQKKYVLEFPFPCKFDAKNKRYLFDQPDTWDNVIDRFKKRGPKNREFVERIQRGYLALKKLREEAV